MKCANFVCLNEVKHVGKRLCTNFCNTCRNSPQPYVFECKQCGNTFIRNGQNMGRIPLTCSQKCRNRRRYVMSGRARSKTYQRKPRPKVKKQAKLCKNCDEAFKGFARRVFCSKSCATRYRETTGRAEKIYESFIRVKKQYLHQQKPQEVLYVTPR
jgi:hypothetical protein